MDSFKIILYPNSELSNQEITEKEKNIAESFFKIINLLNNFENRDVEEMEKILKVCDESLISHIFDDAMILDLNINVQDYLHHLILEKLNLVKNEEKIGDILTRECLGSYKILGYSLILFDFDNVSKQSGFSDIKPLIYNDLVDLSCYGRADFFRNVIELYLTNLDSIKLEYEKLGCDNENAINLEILFRNISDLSTIRHEFRHFLQTKINDNSSEIEKLKCDFSDYAGNIPNVYELFHDYFPIEIDAIAYSIIETIDFLNNIRCDSEDDEYFKVYWSGLVGLCNDFDKKMLEYGYFDRMLKINDINKLLLEGDKMLSQLYPIIDYSVSLILKDRDNKLECYYNVYKCIRIFQRLIEMSPNSSTYIKYLKKNIKGFKNNIIFKKFDCQKELHIPEIREMLLLTTPAFKVMNDCGFECEKYKDEELFMEFSNFLIDKGYSDEDIDKFYLDFYNDNPDLGDYVSFLYYVSRRQCLRHPLPKETSKTKKKIRRILHRIN